MAALYPVEPGPDHDYQTQTQHAQNKALISLATIRGLEEGDTEFIYSTMLRGLYHGNAYFNLIDKNTYFDTYARVVENLLLRESVDIILACLKDDPKVILGYSMVEEEKLHWIFIKAAWRGLGLMRKLVPEEIRTVTHLTRSVMPIFQKYKRPRNIKFNPFAI